MHGAWLNILISINKDSVVKQGAWKMYSGRIPAENTRHTKPGDELC